MAKVVMFARCLVGHLGYRTLERWPAAVGAARPDALVDKPPVAPGGQATSGTRRSGTENTEGAERKWVDRVWLGQTVSACMEDCRQRRSDEATERRRVGGDWRRMAGAGRISVVGFGRPNSSRGHGAECRRRMIRSREKRRCSRAAAHRQCHAPLARIQTSITND